MKIINLDELELKCIEFGIKNNLFTRDELKDKNLFSVNLRGMYRSKTCDIWFEGLHNEPITFLSKSWENLYYQLDIFFMETWEYSKHKDRLPLYMKIAEAIGKQSKNGFVNASKINEEISKLL